MIFLKRVIESMGIKIKIKLPIVIKSDKSDNAGAIYLPNNYTTTSQRTKRIDIRDHFIRQYIED